MITNQALYMLCRTAMLPIKPLTEMSHPSKMEELSSAPFPGVWCGIREAHCSSGGLASNGSRALSTVPGMHLLIGFSFLLLLLFLCFGVGPHFCYI